MLDISCNSRGRRRLTPGHLVAAQLSRNLNRTTLPPRAAVKTAVMRVGRLLDWPRWAGETLHALLEFCASWDQGDLVVWASNDRLSHELAIGRRALSARLFQLAELGLIHHRDRPGCRRGRSPNGQSFGIDISPLAALYPRFDALVASDARTYAELRDLRRQLRQRLIDIENLLALASSFGIAAEEAHSSLARLSHRAFASITTCDTDQLRCAIKEANDLALIVEDSIATQTHPIPLGGIVTTREVESAMPPETSTIQYHQLESDRGGRPKPTGTLHQPSGMKIAPKEAVRYACCVAPEITETAGIDDLEPHEFVETARWLGASIGIDQERWGDGCGLIGRFQTALVIGLLLDAIRRQNIARPVGLFDWFIKAEKNDPGHTIKLLLNKYKKKKPHMGALS